LNVQQDSLKFHSFQTISICRFQKQRVRFPTSKSLDSIRHESLAIPRHKSTSKSHEHNIISSREALMESCLILRTIHFCKRRRPAVWRQNSARRSISRPWCIITHMIISAKRKSVGILISNGMTGGAFRFTYSTASGGPQKTKYKDRKRATRRSAYKTISPALAQLALETRLWSEQQLLVTNKRQISEKQIKTRK